MDRSQSQRIVIRRKHVFEDALHRYKSGLDFKKYLKVTFVGEPAADEGGPPREFFNLLISSISRNTNLFCGDEGNRTPQVNAVELSKQTYSRVGEMIATLKLLSSLARICVLLLLLLSTLLLYRMLIPSVSLESLSQVTSSGTLTSPTFVLRPGNN